MEYFNSDAVRNWNLSDSFARHNLKYNDLVLADQNRGTNAV